MYYHGVTYLSYVRILPAQLPESIFEMCVTVPRREESLDYNSLFIDAVCDVKTQFGYYPEMCTRSALFGFSVEFHVLFVFEQHSLKKFNKFQIALQLHCKRADNLFIFNEFYRPALFAARAFVVAHKHGICIQMGELDPIASIMSISRV